MPEGFDITVENKMTAQKRDMNIYHHANRSSHIITYNSSITFPLRTVKENDYLHLSIISGPGNLYRDCLINMPSWADFEFSSGENITLTHLGDRTLLKIPPGPPVWQLKITRPNGPLTVKQPGQITISDEGPGGR